MPNDFTSAIIAEFRANHGRVGGPFEEARLLLLTTRGARTGNPHTVPLGRLVDGDRDLVIASAMGADRHPQWFRNLLAHPEVTVEDGLFIRTANAAPLEGAERDRLFARAAEADAGWADYQARTDRVLPVVALETTGMRPVEMPPSEYLPAVHGGFRRELALIRAEVARSGPGSLGAQLRANCLALCDGVHHHHTGEDTMMFPALLAADPSLEPAIEKLSGEHVAVAALVAEFRDLVSDPAADRASVLPRVDAIIADLEAHFDVEERSLAAALAAG